LNPAGGLLYQSMFLKRGLLWSCIVTTVFAALWFASMSACHVAWIGWRALNWFAVVGVGEGHFVMSTRGYQSGPGGIGFESSPMAPGNFGSLVGVNSFQNASGTGTVSHAIIWLVYPVILVLGWLLVLWAERRSASASLPSSPP
jgi:hypothetical protein